MRWYAEIIRDFDGTFYVNLTINDEPVGGLPQYVPYRVLQDAIFNRTGIRLLNRNQLPDKYWIRCGRKRYAYLDATCHREDCRVTPEEIRNGWKPDF